MFSGGCVLPLSVSEIYFVFLCFVFSCKCKLPPTISGADFLHFLCLFQSFVYLCFLCFCVCICVFCVFVFVLAVQSVVWLQVTPHCKWGTFFAFCVPFLIICVFVFSVFLRLSFSCNLVCECELPPTVSVTHHFLCFFLSELFVFLCFSFVCLCQLFVFFPVFSYVFLCNARLPWVRVASHCQCDTPLLIPPH